MDTDDVVCEDSSVTLSMQTDAPLFNTTELLGSSQDPYRDRESFKSIEYTTDSMQSFHSTQTNFGRSHSVLEIKVSSTVFTVERGEESSR